LGQVIEWNQTVSNVFYKEFQMFIKKIDYENIKKIFNDEIQDDLGDHSFEHLLRLTQLPVNKNNAFIKFVSHIYQEKSIIQNNDIDLINGFKDILLEIKEYVLPSKHQEYNNILFYFNQAVNNILDINNLEYKKKIMNLMKKSDLVF
jgi:hypothetical protein